MQPDWSKPICIISSQSSPQEVAFLSSNQQEASGLVHVRSCAICLASKPTERKVISKHNTDQQVPEDRSPESKFMLDSIDVEVIPLMTSVVQQQLIDATKT
jgi:hypothetical protein